MARESAPSVLRRRQFLPSSGDHQPRAEGCQRVKLLSIQLLALVRVSLKARSTRLRPSSFTKGGGCRQHSMRVALIGNDVQRDLVAKNSVSNGSLVLRMPGANHISLIAPPVCQPSPLRFFHRCNRILTGKAPRQTPSPAAPAIPLSRRFSTLSEHH